MIRQAHKLVKLAEALDAAGRYTESDEALDMAIRLAQQYGAGRGMEAIQNRPGIGVMNNAAYSTMGISNGFDPDPMGNGRLGGPGPEHALNLTTVGINPGDNDDTQKRKMMAWWQRPEVQEYMRTNPAVRAQYANWLARMGLAAPAQITHEANGNPYQQAWQSANAPGAAQNLQNQQQRGMQSMQQQLQQMNQQLQTESGIMGQPIMPTPPQHGTANLPQAPKPQKQPQNAIPPMPVI